VETPARRYIEYSRRHMEREERALFPLARQVLGDADWQWIDAHSPPVADPLFGDAVHERYRMLHARIAAEVGCDCEASEARVS
jgi:hemerythrin-like domain-containing protein